jgi:hypothetical protein
VITLQIADPSSHQRGRPTDTRPQISDSNIPTGSNIWSQVPQGCSIPRHADLLTVSRKVTPTSMVQSKVKVKSKSRHDRRPVNQYVLVPSPVGIKKVSIPKNFNSTSGRRHGRNRVAQLYPGHWFPPPHQQRYTWKRGTQV